jgi:hypothetical protein
MKITLALLASLAVSAVHAYTPPTDQADGIYSVTFDGSGEPVTKRHEETLARPLSAKFRRSAADLTSSTSLQTRDFPGQQVACGTREISNHHDYSVVQNCLSTWLDQNTNTGGGGAVFYCRAGDTLLAICNYPSTIYGSRAEIDNFNGVMDRTCGAWKSGYVFIKDWNKTVSLGANNVE